MRTTLKIDDDILTLARTLADARRISVGEAISYLARRGAEAQVPFDVKNDFVVFSVSGSSPRFGPAEIQKALEKEDHSYAAYLRKQKP